MARRCHPGFTPGATQWHPTGCGTKPGNRAGTGACPYTDGIVAVAPRGRPALFPVWFFPLARFPRWGERGAEGVRAPHRNPGFTPGATQWHPTGCGTKPGNRAGTGACPYTDGIVAVAPRGRPALFPVWFFPLARFPRWGERGAEGVRAPHRNPGFTPGATQWHPTGCGTKPGNRAGTGACPYTDGIVAVAPTARASYTPPPGSPCGCSRYRPARGR